MGERGPPGPAARSRAALIVAKRTRCLAALSLSSCQNACWAHPEAFQSLSPTRSLATVQGRVLQPSAAPHVLHVQEAAPCVCNSQGKRSSQDAVTEGKAS